MDDDSEEEMLLGKSSQVFCLTWVKRNAAKLIPNEMGLENFELKDIETENSDNINSSDEDQSEDEQKSKDVKTIKVESGNTDDDDDDLDEFDFDNYDDESGDGLSDLVEFPSSGEDPYVTKENDSDDERERDAMQLKIDDNLIISARCDKDFSALEVHVYNHDSKDFYTHHDIPLSSAPLCMQWLNFCVGNTTDAINEKGNFVAIGNMNSVIEIWDLDVLSSVEPTCKLGVPQKMHEKLLRKGHDDFGHTDAVMDLSWTPVRRSKLASASADHLVVLWDLEKSSLERIFASHKEKVQTLEWKPSSSHCLLSGAFDGRIIALDTRSKASSSGHMKWKFKGEIERVTWNPTRTHYFAASTDSGTIHYCDVRKPKTSLFRFKAHDRAVPTMCMTSSLLYTGSSEGIVKSWKIENDASAELMEEKDMKMGMIHCFSLNPDVSNLFAVGGERDGVKLWNSQQTNTSDALQLAENFGEEASDGATESTPDKIPKLKKNKSKSKVKKKSKNMNCDITEDSNSNTNNVKSHKNLSENVRKQKKRKKVDGKEINSKKIQRKKVTKAN